MTVRASTRCSAPPIAARAAVPGPEARRMASFEVQRYTGGDWQPHSDFDDKGFAIEAARDLMSGGRAPGAVRVVEVLDGERPPRTVFRQSALDEHNTRTRRERF